MFALAWWCYPIVMACVAVPMAFFWLIERRRDAREAREDGPFPCLAYLGRDVELGELWCWLLYGHDGDHESQFGLDDDTVFTREWPEDDGSCLCGADHSSPDFSFDQMAGTEDEHRTLLGDGEDLEYVSPGVYKIIPAPLPPLPQRLSKVPAQTEHNDPQCSDPHCMLDSGHVGGHDYI